MSYKTNYRVNYRQLLPITIGPKARKVYLQGSFVSATAPTTKFIRLKSGERVEVMQIIGTQAEVGD